MSRNSLRKSVKHGIGRLTASTDRLSPRSTTMPITRLTRVAHKAPTRLIPVKKASVQQVGAAICALSNYGGGMLQGDSAELSVNVEAGAKLGLVTQGAGRIYTQRVSSVCETRMHATVEKDGILVFAPDSCTLFASSSYSQYQEYEIHPESSIALIDWFSSGRFKNQERWEFDNLQTCTKLKWLKTEGTQEDENLISDNLDNVPFLIDSTSIDLRRNRQMNTSNHDTHAVADFNCFASLILYGEHIQSVKNRCQSLSVTFAAKYTRTRIRERDQCDKEWDSIDTDIYDNLAGRVIIGVSKVSLRGKPSDAYVVRFAGKTNEDLYRIFHTCLIPMAPSFGIEFYKDRILAQRSEIPTITKKVSRDPGQEVYKVIERTTNTIPRQKLANDLYPVSSLGSMPMEMHSSFWSIMMLADSGLPTGSFSHSAGLEAATQLRMIEGEEDVLNYVQAATRSSIQLLAPFLISSLRIVQRDGVNDIREAINVRDCWDKLNRECNAVMVTNEPACSASIDQGKSLARVATQWLGEEFSHLDILDCLRNDRSPHMAPTLGVISGLLGLDEIQVCRLFAYCLARDMVSSAVRLSLIGPLASVPLLNNVQESAEDSIRAVYTAILNHPENPLLVAASSAPVIEAIHPCHEILQVRLFRS